MLIKNLCISFGGRQIFTKYNAELGDRQIILLWGENGSGKTTLMKVIAGLIKTAPEVTNGFPTSVCYVPTNISEFILPRYTPQKNIIYFSRYKYNSEQALIAFDEFLSSFKIGWSSSDLCNTRASFLSAGQKVLLAMLCVELLNPSLILFDETFSTLSYNLRECICNWISNIAKDGKKIVICSHDYHFSRAITKDVFEIQAAKYLPIEEVLSK